ncbi:MAG TPA: ABC transporter ATP-binding protein [Clostridiaceae bacterium]|nr:ABC transporter ATP-binding protein [Clostridiaceae bacterium]
MEIFKRIIGLLRPYRKRTVIATGLLIIVLTLRLISPYLTKILIDDVIEKGNRELLTTILALIFGLEAIISVSVFFRHYMFEKTSQDVVFDLRKKIYGNLQEMPYEYYDKTRIGEIMSRLTSDLDGVRSFICSGIVVIIENLVYFVASSVILFTMNAMMASLVLITAPFLAYVGWRFNKIIRPIYNDIREQNAVLNTRAQENIAGVRVVKAFAKEDYEKETFKAENRKHLEKHLKASSTWADYYPVMDFISGLGSVLFLWAGGYMVVANKISLGTLVAFTGYIWMITSPMRSYGSIINTVAHAISSGERVLELMSIGSSLKESENPVFPGNFQGHIVFDNVSFKYNENYVLHNINLDLEPGKTLGIVGATGSGKTTIINLLGRFYDCTQGKITIDGIDIKKYKLKELRQQISYVMQETFLFSDTIEANISFAVPDAGMDKIVEAAKAAQAHEFIMNMPLGYNTIIGERGMGLSGGQRQRIALARAILKNAPILVLDDSTSSVDMETEYEIQTALDKIQKNKTTIIIAHRISSVKNADQIIVLDQGRIVERGTHDSLIALQGYYYRTYMDQCKDFFELKQIDEVLIQ